MSMKPKTYLRKDAHSQSSAAVAALLVFACLGNATAQDTPKANTRTELICEINKEAIRQSIASETGGATEQQHLEFLAKNELLSFRIAYWQTEGGSCRALVGRHPGICILTDNAVSFSYPEIAADPGAHQSLLLDRYSGVMRFLRYKRLQYICTPQRQLF